VRHVDLVVEDVIQEQVLRRVVATTKGLVVDRVHGLCGAGFVDANIRRYARAASHVPFVIARDLDAAECAPALAARLLPERTHPGLLLAIAVREVEAWLIADRVSLASFLGAPGMDRADPESIADPKQFIVRAAAGSRSRNVRRDLVPVGRAVVGQLYNRRMVEFIRNHWRVEVAAKSAPSLGRLLTRLETFGATITVSDA
jgi:hypothetical protein